MDLKMSQQAWIALGCLVGILVFSGLVLWSAWRRGKAMKPQAPPPERSEGPSFMRSWRREEDQYAELARQAESLREQEKDQTREKDLPQ